MNLIPALFKAVMAKGFNVPTPSNYTYLKIYSNQILKF